MGVMWRNLFLLGEEGTRYNAPEPGPTALRVFMKVLYHKANSAETI